MVEFKSNQVYSVEYEYIFYEEIDYQNTEPNVDEQKGTQLGNAFFVVTIKK